MPSGARAALVAYDESIEIAPPQPGRVLKVRAPADYDWAAATKAVLTGSDKFIRAYREDDVIANFADAEKAVRREFESGQLQAKAQRPERTAWQVAAFEDSWCAVERGLLRRIRGIDAARQRAWDPRLQEVVEVARAIEHLWRVRLTDESFERWMGVRGVEEVQPLAENALELVGKRRVRSAAAGKLSRMDSYGVGYVVTELAWARIADRCGKVAVHVERLAASANDEAGASLQQLGMALREIERIAAAMVDRAW